MLQKRWRPDELVQLILRYPEEGANVLAQEFQRSRHAVNSQARRLRLPALTRRQRQGRTFKLRRARAQAAIAR